MSEDLPPIIPVFNTLDFNKDFFVSSSDGLTYNEAAAKFLKYPNAQGAETLQQTTINGILTSNSTSNFNDILTMTSTDNLKREIKTSWTTLLDTGNNATRFSKIVQNGFNFDIINYVLQGAINFRVFSAGGIQIAPIIANYVNTIISNNLQATSTSEFRKAVSINDTTDANNRVIASSFYNFYDAGSIALSSIGTIYNQSGAMYIQNTFNGGSISLVVDNASGTQISPLQITATQVLVNNTLDVVNNDISVQGIRIGLGGGNFVRNMVVGYNAGISNTTGLDNVFVGTQSGQANTTGASNAFFGAFAGRFNTTGTNNTFIGRDAGYAFTTGNLNTFIGREAGYFNNGSQNVFIGNGADATGVINNSIAIGSGVKATASNTIVLGTSSHTTQIAGNINILGIVNVDNILSVRNSTTITNKLDISTDNAQNTTIRARSATASTSAILNFNLDVVSALGVVTTNNVATLTPFNIEVKRPIQFNYSSTPNSTIELGFITGPTSIGSGTATSLATERNFSSFTIVNAGTYSIKVLISMSGGANHSLTECRWCLDGTSATFPSMTTPTRYTPSITGLYGSSLSNTYVSYMNINLDITTISSNQIIYINYVLNYTGGSTTTLNATYSYTRIG